MARLSRFEREVQAEKDAWIQTYSGKKFHPLHPSTRDIDVLDIAHALSNQCRFGGHTRQFYSVAQHSVLVSQLCDPCDALWGLLHDAAEAYLVDMPRPIKYTPQLDVYRGYEMQLQAAICFAFGLQIQQPESVKRADYQLLCTEADQLLGPLHPDWEARDQALAINIAPYPPDIAREAFLDRFEELTAVPRG